MSEDFISRSKVPFLTILVSLERGENRLSNDTKIVENGALELEIRSSEVCIVLQTIL